MAMRSIMLTTFLFFVSTAQAGLMEIPLDRATVEQKIVEANDLNNKAQSLFVKRVAEAIETLESIKNKNQVFNDTIDKFIVEIENMVPGLILGANEEYTAKIDSIVEAFDTGLKLADDFNAFFESCQNRDCEPLLKDIEAQYKDPIAAKLKFLDISLKQLNEESLHRPWNYALSEVYSLQHNVFSSFFKIVDKTPGVDISAALERYSAFQSKYGYPNLRLYQLLISSANRASLRDLMESLPFKIFVTSDWAWSQHYLIPVGAKVLSNGDFNLELTHVVFSKRNQNRFSEESLLRQAFTQFNLYYYPNNTRVLFHNDGDLLNREIGYLDQLGNKSLRK